MLEEIKRHLQTCGLTHKEADVYVALLELGPASVQDIGRKAGVNRSTTYLTLESLKRRGLVSTFEQRKKTLMVGESPERLMAGVMEEISSIQAKRARLETCVPHLLALFQASGLKPRVRFFEGEEALAQVRQEIGNAREPLWEVYAVDEPLIQLANIRAPERIQVTKRLGGRVLMSIKPGLTPPYFDARGIEVRSMDYAASPFSGDVAMIKDTLYIVTMRMPGMGIIIESADIVRMFRALYEAAWSCARPWVPPTGWKPTE